MSTLVIPDAVVENVAKILLPELDPVDIMDYLYQEHALSEDEYEVISKTIPRRRRCCLLLNSLKQRPNLIYNFKVLVNSLESAYGFLIGDVRRALSGICYTKDKHGLTAGGTPRDRRTGPGLSSCTSKRPPSHCCSLFDRKGSGDNIGGVLSPKEPILRENCGVSSETTDSSTGFFDVVCKAGGGLFTNRLARTCFDRLSTMLNKGMINEFDSRSKALIRRNNLDPDVRCVALYLQGCRHAFSNNFEEGESILNEAESLSKKTSSPIQYLVKIMSARCLICIKSRQYQTLLSHLTDAAQLIFTNPILCEGMSAGWIFVDKARYTEPLLTSKETKRTKKLTEQALDNVDRAIEQFQREQSKDGPFGYGFALVLKAALLLACGEKMNTVTLKVSEKNIKLAASLLSLANDLPIGMPKILETVYSITMTDLFIRRGNLTRALEYAIQALDLAQHLSFPEQQTQAIARVKFLQPLVIQEEDRRNIATIELISSPSSDSLVEQTCETAGTTRRVICRTMGERACRKRKPRTLGAKIHAILITCLCKALHSVKWILLSFVLTNVILGNVP